MEKAKTRLKERVPLPQLFCPGRPPPGSYHQQGQQDLDNVIHGAEFIDGRSASTSLSHCHRCLSDTEVRHVGNEQGFNLWVVAGVIVSKLGDESLVCCPESSKQGSHRPVCSRLPPRLPRG